MKNLLLYDVDLKVHNLLNSFDGDLKDGIFNSNLKYIEVPQKIFDYLAKKTTDIIHFIEQPDKLDGITEKDFKFTPKPAPPKPLPTQTELLGAMVMEMKLNNFKLQQQVEFLGKTIMDMKLERGR